MFSHNISFKIVKVELRKKNVPTKIHLHGTETRFMSSHLQNICFMILLLFFFYIYTYFFLRI